MMPICKNLRLQFVDWCVKQGQNKMEGTSGYKQWHLRYLYLQYSPRAWQAEKEKKTVIMNEKESVGGAQIDTVTENFMLEEKKGGKTSRVSAAALIYRWKTRRPKDD